MNWSEIKSKWHEANPKWKEFTLFQKLFGEKGWGLVLLILFIIIVLINTIL